MTLEKLEIGMKVANYRKLCELLNEPMKNGGTAKNAQLKEWERHFAFERQGNAYIITEIYDTPKLSADARMTYMQYVEPLLLHYLSKWCSGDRLVEHTFRSWCTEIGLASYRAYDDNTADEYQVLVSSGYGNAAPVFSTLAVQKARYEITRFAKTVLLRAVRVLEKKRIIQAKSVDYVVHDVGNREADADESSYIENAKQRVLASMQLNSMFPVNMSPKKQKEFYERLHELYRTEKGWAKTYWSSASGRTEHVRRRMEAQRRRVTG